jgi:hypothetical protein
MSGRADRSGGPRRLRRGAGADRRLGLVPSLRTSRWSRTGSQAEPRRKPLSVDGMIVAASATLRTDSLAWRRGGVLPWALLAVGSVASLAVNVAVAGLHPNPMRVARRVRSWEPAVRAAADRWIRLTDDDRVRGPGQRRARLSGLEVIGRRLS